MNELTFEQLIQLVSAQTKVIGYMQDQIVKLAEQSLEHGKNLTELVEYLNKEKDMSIVFNQN